MQMVDQPLLQSTSGTTLSTPSPKVPRSPRGSHLTPPTLLLLARREALQNTKLKETGGFTQGFLCQKWTEVSLLAFSLTGCLRTHVTERVLAGLGAAWNDGACLGGDKKDPLRPGDLGFCDCC